MNDEKKKLEARISELEAGFTAIDDLLREGHWPNTGSLQFIVDTRLGRRPVSAPEPQRCDNPKHDDPCFKDGHRTSNAPLICGTCCGEKQQTRCPVCGDTGVVTDPEDALDFRQNDAPADGVLVRPGNEAYSFQPGDEVLVRGRILRLDQGDEVYTVRFEACGAVSRSEIEVDSELFALPGEQRVDKAKATPPTRPLIAAKFFICDLLANVSDPETHRRGEMVLEGLERVECEQGTDYPKVTEKKR